MTDAELQAYEDEAIGGCSSCVTLVREVRRLMALVKRAEWDGPTLGQRSYSCPWCEAAFAPREDMSKHDADCPAFTPDGRVR